MHSRTYITFPSITVKSGIHTIPKTYVLVVLTTKIFCTSFDLRGMLSFWLPLISKSSRSIEILAVIPVFPSLNTNNLLAAIFQNPAVYMAVTQTVFSPK